MRVLVLSDSHGDVDNMCEAVELFHPDMTLHLGDGWYDAERLADYYPDIPVVQVAGNCDFKWDEPVKRIITIEDKRIMMCHGHTLGVKTDLGMLLRVALEERVDAVLFGHTHKPFVDIRNGVVMLNPGSIGASRRPTFGSLTFEDGKILPSTHIL